MTPQQFRKIALSLPDTVESEHMGYPDFRIAGKVFASLGAPNDDWGMVKLTPEQQRALCAAHAGAFQPCSGAWGRQGYTNVKLATVKTADVRSALTLAVENMPGQSSRKSSPRRSEDPSAHSDIGSPPKATVARIQARVLKIVDSLPEATAVPVVDEHVSSNEELPRLPRPNRREADRNHQSECSNPIRVKVRPTT